MKIFNKKLPAWMLMAALVIVGAGAATGLVLKDQITGTTTIAVGQALYVSSIGSVSGADASLATIEDDGSAWAVHLEANNGDEITFTVTLSNRGANYIAFLLTMDIPTGITVSLNGDGSTEEVVQIGPNQWKSGVEGAGSNGLDFTIAIEDAAATGFYELDSTIDPINV